MKKKSNKTISLKFRVTPAEESKIQMLAKLYAGGNMSQWLRHAALNAHRVTLRVKDE